MYPSIFTKLIDIFKYLPGVGQKTAERYAFSILQLSSTQVEDMIKTLESIKDIKYCNKCHIITQYETCNICTNTNRNNSIICVVNNSKDAIAIENIGTYKGLYHILGNLISPNKGILPEHINIDSLLKRITIDTKEIILATDPTLDGEITALYISKILKNENIKITRLAHGLPMGSHLDYADELTLTKAFNGRTQLEE